MADSGGSADEIRRTTRRAIRISRDQRLSLAGDVLAWIIAISAVFAFFERSVLIEPSPELIALAAVAQVVIGLITGVYSDRFRRLSFDEAGAVGLTAIGVGIIIVGAEFVGQNSPRGGQMLIMATSAALTLMFAHRYVQRIVASRKLAAESAHKTPIVVVGAGEGGYRAIQAMESSASPYRPVALIDDDPAKRSLRIQGVRVEGTHHDLEHVLRRHHAEAVLLALPTASGDDLKHLHDQIAGLGVETLVMPPVQRLVGTGSTKEFTRYRDEDVLNRRIVDIDSAAIRQLVTGSSVLVTGAGGSIGSELVRQLMMLEPARLTCVDHDDSLLHHLKHSIPAADTELCIDLLADIRDPDRLDEIVADAQPDLLFHAAALKHVPALEAAPGEAWKTNVIGTSNVLDVCETHGVARVVNISTDKAADPDNVLGFSKRIAERLTAQAARRTGRPFVSVRFGNVIGSRGSALETFERQIAEGGPVTITDREVTRYFMAVREAVRLTMQAAAIGRAGEALVLDMGSPVRVDDVARQLIEQSGDDIPIVYTGLRPGEKMHEVLLGHGESAHRPLHPMIDHVRVPPLQLVHALDRCVSTGQSPLTTEGLKTIAAHPQSGNLGITTDGHHAPSKEMT